MNDPSAPPDGVVEVDGPPPLEVKLESAPSNAERPDGAPPPTEGAPGGGGGGSGPRRGVAPRAMREHSSRCDSRQSAPWHRLLQ